ncbi:MAG: aldehyde dehydrogenase family protein [Oscillospiraceae bacterium]|nr:aldehyde dehydrogenase family protein [Oscillospiraceae bacterium]
MEPKEFIESLIAKARIAQKEYEQYTQEQADAIVKACAKAVYDNAEYLADLAVKETQMGVYEHKIQKNKGKAKIIWNSLKDKQSVGILSRNAESGITEIARPVGVVGAVTPCTNPVVTPMCNAMFALKGLNAIIIGPHPRAKKTSTETVRLMNEAIAKLGAPKDLIQIIDEPTIELSAELMKSVDVVVATGGMPMVKSAYSSGKPAYGVGAGNVQCIIDRGVDYAKEVPMVVEGRAFDNGIICSGEQTAIIPEEDYDKIIAEFVKAGCYYIDDADTVAKVTDTIFPNGVMNKKLVGVSALAIAEAAGIKVPANTRVILLKAPGYGKGYLLSKEKMCPVISTYSYKTFEEAVEIAQANLNVEGRGHSVSLHSNDKAHIEYAGEKLTVSRVLINQICSTMNGGSFFNSLTPTTTLGCASWGNNSISENFSYKFLINVIRIAYRLDNAKVPTDEEIWA